MPPKKVKNNNQENKKENNKKVNNIKNNKVNNIKTNNKKENKTNNKVNNIKTNNKKENNKKVNNIKNNKVNNKKENNNQENKKENNKNVNNIKNNKVNNIKTNNKKENNKKVNNIKNNNKKENNKKVNNIKNNKVNNIKTNNKKENKTNNKVNNIKTNNKKENKTNKKVNNINKKGNNKKEKKVKEVKKNLNKNCNKSIKNKLQNAKNNYSKNPGDPSEMHRFYDRVIKLASNTSNTLFKRKEPKQNWSKYKTEEEYEESLKDSVNFSKKFTEKEKKDIDVIIYNKGNADGVMSGYIAWNFITEGGTNGKDVKILYSNPDFRKSGISYNITRFENFLKDKNVIMVDLSFNKETIEYVKNITNFFINIDNHLNDEISELPYVHITKSYQRTDDSHAACAGVWKFFHPKEKVPYVIQSVDSTDAKLYLSYLPDPSPISTALGVKFVKNQTKTEYIRNPEKMFMDINTFLSSGNQIQALNFLAVLGQIMERFAENMKAEIAPKAFPGIFKFKDKRYKVYVLNYAQPGLQKRVAKNIASSHPDADFSVLWFYNHRERAFDFTLSTAHVPGKEYVDILKIAKSYNGGGGGFKDSTHFKVKGNLGDFDKIITFNQSYY